MTYKENFAKLTDEVKPASLMAVSKTRNLEEVKQAYEAGYRLFGENHVQEIVEKFSVFKPLDLKLHMIGHLQSNKVTKVVPLVDMIESIDSFELLEKVDRASEKCNKITKVLLEYNAGLEESKSGFLCEKDILDCLKRARSLKNIKVCGLMTVGPANVQVVDKAFKEVKRLYDKCCDLGFDFDTLSMGMSGDYKIAVKCGSTEVRIGTAIFGERHYV